MSITYSTPVEGAAAVSAIASGSLIAAFSDGSGRSRTFIPPVAPESGTAASAVFPSLTSATAVTWEDQIDIESVLSYGPVTLVLKAGTADIVSSPGMAFVLDQDASVITVSGTY